MQLRDFALLRCGVPNIMRFNYLIVNKMIVVNNQLIQHSSAISPIDCSLDFKLKDGDMVHIGRDSYKYVEPIPCDICGCLWENKHSSTCPNIPNEQKIEEYDYYVNLCRELRMQLLVSHTNSRDKITLWQGKYKIVKEENNALRKKLYGLPDRGRKPKKCLENSDR
jgi:hypothetical protein